MLRGHPMAVSLSCWAQRPCCSTAMVRASERRVPRCLVQATAVVGTAGVLTLSTSRPSSVVRLCCLATTEYRLSRRWPIFSQWPLNRGASGPFLDGRTTARYRWRASLQVGRRGTSPSPGLALSPRRRALRQPRVRRLPPGGRRWLLSSQPSFQAETPCSCGRSLVRMAVPTSMGSGRPRRQMAQSFLPYPAAHHHRLFGFPSRRRTRATGRWSTSWPWEHDRADPRSIAITPGHWTGGEGAWHGQAGAAGPPRRPRTPERATSRNADEWLVRQSRPGPSVPRRERSPRRAPSRASYPNVGSQGQAPGRQMLRRTSVVPRHLDLPGHREGV